MNVVFLEASFWQLKQYKLEGHKRRTSNVVLFQAMHFLHSDFSTFRCVVRRLPRLVSFHDKVYSLPSAPCANELAPSTWIPCMRKWSLKRFQPTSLFRWRIGSSPATVSTKRQIAHSWLLSVLESQSQVLSFCLRVYIWWMPPSRVMSVCTIAVLPSSF